MGEGVADKAATCRDSRVRGSGDVWRQKASQVDFACVTRYVPLVEVGDGSCSSIIPSAANVASHDLPYQEGGSYKRCSESEWSCAAPAQREQVGVETTRL